MHGLIDKVFYSRKLNVDKKLSSLEALDDTHIMRSIGNKEINHEFGINFKCVQAIIPFIPLIGKTC